MRFPAFFLGIVGAVFGNMIGFIDPLEVAFPAPTFGVWMVLMAILGGKGTLWGPVIGAVLFHVIKELFWTYLLGWQRVALGVLIVVIVVFFPAGHPGLGARALARAVRASSWTADDDAGEDGRPMSALIEVDGVSQVLRRRGRQPRHLAQRAAGRDHRPDRSERLGQDDAVQLDRRLSPDRRRLDPLRRAGDLANCSVPQIARLGLLRTFQQTRIYGKMNCVQNMLICDPARARRR